MAASGSKVSDLKCAFLMHQVWLMFGDAKFSGIGFGSIIFGCCLEASGLATLGLVALGLAASVAVWSGGIRL